MSTASAALGTDTEVVRAGHKEFLFPCAPPYYQEPLVLVDAQGVTVVDSDGREFLDLFSGILTTALGHCHPEVVEHVQHQLGTLGHTSAEREIDRLTITAPFGGLLESDAAEIGSLLQPGALCATVIQLDPIKLVGFIPETDSPSSARRWAP